MVIIDNIYYREVKENRLLLLLKKNIPIWIYDSETDDVQEVKTLHELSDYLNDDDSMFLEEIVEDEG